MPFSNPSLHRDIAWKQVLHVTTTCTGLTHRLWMRSFHKHLNKLQTGRPHTLKVEVVVVVGGATAALQHRAFLHMQMWRWCEARQTAGRQRERERFGFEPSPAGPPPKQTTTHIHLLFFYSPFLSFVSLYLFHSFRVGVGFTDSAGWKKYSHPSFI